ncbi:MAG TPA: hypothetical protein VG167_19805 [Verrucomicrobiae bacterium]|nr:hypothetical protein [Verrucomicrobiae bacterium]
MSKRVIALVVFVLVCLIVRGAETNILSSASPNLKKFLSGHPTAMTEFTNAMWGTFSNRTVKIFYYYSDDPDDRRPSHFSPHTAGMPDVIICVAQDSRPVDEFIGILYEMLNSKGEKRFGDLCEKAQAGTISRDDFAREVLRVEFDAVRCWLG